MIFVKTSHRNKDFSPIKKGAELHVYKFQWNGDVNYYMCAVTSVYNDKGRTRVSFKPLARPSDFTAYAYEDEIDRRCGRVSKTMIAVLTKPDFETAKQLVLSAIQDSIDRKKADLERIEYHMQVLLESTEPFEE